MGHERPTRRAVLGTAIGLAVSTGCSADPYRPESHEPAATRGAGPPRGDRRVVVQGVSYSVPAHPSRVVALGDAALQPLLDLGAPVVATSSVSPATVPPSLRRAVRSLPVVGTGREGDAVTAADVLAYAPDVVVTVEGVPRRLVDELGAQRPVILLRTTGSFARSWQRRITELGEVVAPGRAGELSRDLDLHAERVRRTTASARSDAPAVLLRAWDRRRLTAYGPASVIGALCAAVGVRFAEAVSVGGEPGRPGEFDDTLDRVGVYLRGARAVLLASDYAGGLDAFTGGSLATSDPVKEHVAAQRAVMRGIGPFLVTSHARAHDVLDRVEAAFRELPPPA